MNKTKRISSQVIEVEGGRQAVVQYEKRYTHFKEMIHILL